MNTYEIYVCNSKEITNGMYKGKQAGEVSGWDIKLVATDKDIKKYPFFDCIITKNCHPEFECEVF